MVGRDERFTLLAREVAEPVRRYLVRRCPPDLVDDVVAEVLVVLWRRLDDVPDEPLPWTYGVTRRCLANARRGVRRQAALVDRVGRLDPPQATSPAVPEHVEVHEALDRLPELDREVVRLWAWEGLGPREIAAVLDLSDNAAALRLSRARRKLATLLRQDSSAAGHEPGERRQP